MKNNVKKLANDLSFDDKNMINGPRELYSLTSSHSKSTAKVGLFLIQIARCQ